MNNKKNENNSIYKFIAITCVVLIPLAIVIGVVFDINRDPIQILLMSLGLLLISWINWSKYKELSKL